MSGLVIAHVPYEVVIAVAILAFGVIVLSERKPRRAKSRFEITTLQFNNPKHYGEAVRAIDFTKEQWFVITPYVPGVEEENPVAASESVLMLEGLILFPPTTTFFVPEMMISIQDEMDKDMLVAFPSNLRSPTYMKVGTARFFQFRDPVDPRFRNYLWFHESSMRSGGRFWSVGVQMVEHRITKWVPGQRDTDWTPKKALHFVGEPMNQGELKQ
jgi:hypothetical protein